VARSVDLANAPVEPGGRLGKRPRDICPHGAAGAKEVLPRESESLPRPTGTRFQRLAPEKPHSIHRKPLDPYGAQERREGPVAVHVNVSPLVGPEHKNISTTPP